MKMMNGRIWSRLLDIVSPRSCQVCGVRLSVSEQGICAACSRHLPRTGFVLTPQDNELAREFWGHADVDRAAALLYFAPKSDTARLIYGLKYFARPDIGVILGRMMATEFAPHGFFDGVDVLLPVPLTRWRRWQRGYNQSEHIAQGISEVTGVPVDTVSLRRTKYTVSQTHLSWSEKKANVDNSFGLSSKANLEGKHVMVVDDIITSGSTVLSCIKAITSQEVKAVSVVSLGFTKA